MINTNPIDSIDPDSARCPTDRWFCISGRELIVDLAIQNPPRPPRTQKVISDLFQLFSRRHAGHNDTDGAQLRLIGYVFVLSLSLGASNPTRH
jgi:hypothetical protein